jgi:hypothetical protein
MTLYALPSGLKIRVSGVQFPPWQMQSLWSIPVTWVPMCPKGHLLCTHATTRVFRRNAGKFGAGVRGNRFYGFPRDSTDGSPDDTLVRLLLLQELLRLKAYF